MAHKCVIYRKAKLLFSIRHISITTGLMYVKFKYFMPSIYITSHTKFEENQISSLQDMRCWKLPDFFQNFLLFCTNLKQSLWVKKNKLVGFLCTLIWHILAYLHLKFGDVLAEGEGVMNDCITKNGSKTLVMPTGYSINHWWYGRESFSRDYVYFY